MTYYSNNVSEALGHIDRQWAEITTVPPIPDEVVSAFEQQTLADLPVLTQEDKARFSKIFYSNNPKNGVLTGTFSGHQM